MTTVRDLLALCPRASIAAKPASRLMAVLGALCFFNPRFDAYVTTIGTTIYAPRELRLDSSALEDLIVVAHELVHVFDYLERPWRFALGYLFPQILAAVPLLGLAVLPIAAWGGPGLAALGAFAALSAVGAALAPRSRPAAAILFVAALACVVALALLAELVWGLALTGALLLAVVPWPAPFRSAAEQRGYAMSLAVVHWVTGGIPGSHVALVQAQFVTGNYYWMGPSVRASVIAEAVRSGAVLGWPGPFSGVYRLLGGSRA